MEYKLIAFDMDGTLLQSDKTISDKVARAIHKAAKNGKKIAIATGRCLPELREVFEKAPDIRYIIMTNGAMIYDHKDNKVIYSNLMDMDTVKKILNTGYKRDIMLQILDFECVLEKEKVKVVDTFGMEAYKPMYDAMALQVDDIHEYFNKYPSPLQKINLYHKNINEANQSLEKLKDISTIQICTEDCRIECVKQNTNKGAGFKKLCEYLHIDLKDTIAVGDSYNDLELLSLAGLSVAMGNAIEEVKELCDTTVSDNDHDGCKEVIEKYLLK